MKGKNFKRKRSRSRSSSSSDSDTFIPLAKRQESPKRSHLVAPPWATSSTTRINDPLLLLHNEIIDFYHFIKPTQEETNNKNKIVQKIKDLASEVWPEAQVVVFGSAATGLWLPNSDIDLVVMTNTQEDPVDCILELSHKVLEAKMASQLERITSARVPIMKMKDRETGMLLDISFNLENGVEGSKLIKEYLVNYPEAKYLVLVLKYYLKQRELNETYSGGVGSFLLFCMIISSLQHHPSRREDSQNYSKYLLSQYLVHFLQLYARNFRYEEVGISIREGGFYFNKRTKDWYDDNNPESLCVECPQKTDFDLGRTSKNIKMVKKSFQHALDILLAQDYSIGKTPLSWLIRVDDLIASRSGN